MVINSCIYLPAVQNTLLEVLKAQIGYTGVEGLSL